jgi:REP-associated tyrosine transposase
VTSRGNNRQTVYFADSDLDTFELMLGRVVERYRLLVLTHCLMTNHYHLLIRAPEGGLSHGLRDLNGDFSRWTGRRHGRTGHLFRNRFYSTPIEDEAHLLRAVRYVLLNPVRAGLCERPEEWPWSSYRACVGLDFPPSFLAAYELLSLFGATPRQARAAFRAFVLSGLDEVSDIVNGD